MKAQEQDYERKAYHVLNKLGVNHSFNGVTYLIYLLTYFMENGGECGGKFGGKDGYYGMVAKHFGDDSPMKIERCIWYVIKNMNRDSEMYRTLFPDMEKVTNKQFISAICRYMRYETEDEEKAL